MPKYRLTGLANRDLNGIWEYTFEKWSIKQADSNYNLFIETFDQISLDPDCGRIYDGVEPKLRGFKVGRHIVFYEVRDKQTIEIIRILHQSMDIRNRLKK